ncbi:GNAT family N-acetyltransferase [Devosia sediminis]|uniref:GNAT family N-acetyltransferase n=1 Tax=Devosia sediminis TaxID=2798801 RepID=A0A934MN78_9HYPH|nr:GNAT family N-acetyltransferase [Devosia sediminis]MBJ3786496.1 GNAT family N-acetyltransferase [Devosia sediminis]
MEIVFEPDVLPETRAAILEGLIRYNEQQTAGRFPPPRFIALALRDPQTGTTVGGLTARIAYSRMFVELLYIPEHLRGQGFGADLIGQAEDVARREGCTGIWLDTFSFQAPGFYKKLGYDEFGTLAEYPPGFTRHYLHKTLS